MYILSNCTLSTLVIITYIQRGLFFIKIAIRLLPYLAFSCYPQITVIISYVWWSTWGFSQAFTLLRVSIFINTTTQNIIVVTNRSELNNHWKPVCTGQPICLSIGLSSACLRFGDWDSNSWLAPFTNFQLLNHWAVVQSCTVLTSVYPRYYTTTLFCFLWVLPSYATLLNSTCYSFSLGFWSFPVEDSH